MSSTTCLLLCIILEAVQYYDVLSHLPPPLYNIRSCTRMSSTTCLLLTLLSLVTSGLPQLQSLSQDIRSISMWSISKQNY